MSGIKEESPVAVAPRKRLSCTAYFDALMFCYSPVHQMQQYYRAGQLDNCSGKWSAPVHQMQQYYRAGQLDNCSGKWSGLVDCLTLKTKISSEVEEILEAREKEKFHIWSFRTPKEAASNWEELFGHLDEVE